MKFAQRVWVFDLQGFAGVPHWVPGLVAGKITEHGWPVKMLGCNFRLTELGKTWEPNTALFPRDRVHTEEEHAIFLLTQ